jgi:hypothetical protein
MTQVMVLVVVWNSRATRLRATAKTVKVMLTLSRPAITVHKTHQR